ncbi:MAG: Xaa-Pro peptidase family protein [Rhodospirillaceae bacterium]
MSETPISPIHAERRARLLAAMKEQEVDVILSWGNAWQSDYLRYVTDFPVLEGDAIALVMADGETHLIVEGETEAERARVKCPHLQVEASSDLIDSARAMLTKFGNRRIATAPRTLLPFGLSPESLDRAVEDGTALLDSLLMTKTPMEIDAMRRSSELADRGYQVFRDAAKVGVAEYELVAEIEGFLRAEGCAENFMLIGTGGQEVRGMHPPGERRIQAGDLVTTELSPGVDGYFSQICRTLVVGEPSKAQIDAFQVYIEAVHAGLSVLKAGVTASEIARAENDVFRAYGLGKYCTAEYTRVRGHGLGLFLDTKPHILEDVDTVLQEGAFCIVHPNTYHPVAGYMVLGDASLVTKDGYETFAETPLELLSTAA